MYVNVGAGRVSDNRDFLTKKALKDEIAVNPTNVWIYGTSGFTPFKGNVTELVIGDKYQVTGPNPYTCRKWYATVEKLPSGKITVK
jgi:hypothetical protein